MKALKGTAVILGTSMAIAGMHHGFFEMFEGNNPANGFFVESIGE
jgi:hypothetical protein